MIVHNLQMDVRQRWQTKRGYPGMQHIVDWMTLDLSASAFPNPDQDDFGETFAFLEYDWLWSVGDRTALLSTGWVDPIDDGPRVFTFGAYFDRPDRTSLFLGYRQIDPVQSKAVSAAKAFVSDAAKFVAQAAVQIHGGIGTTDELAISHYFKRATVIENQFGSAAYHLRRVADAMDAED